MKKLLYVILFLGVIVGGIALGRYTGSPQAALPVLKVANKEFPLFPAPPKSDGSYQPAPTAPDKDIIVEAPLDGERPRDVAFDVSGRAKAGGSPLSVTVTAEDGSQLFSVNVTPTAAAGEPYGRFVAHVTLDALPAAPVTLTVKRVSAPADAGDTADVRKLAFGGSSDVSVNIYLSNDGFADAGECSTVYPVARQVPANVAVYRAAIEELLKGPNALDVTSSYGTAIPAGVSLKSVGADAEGTVTADFTSQLTRNVNDACRLEKMRSQIAATLRQFPEVRDVVITVAGEADVFGTSKDN